MSANRAAALTYADTGIPVFPTAPGTKLPLLSKREGGRGLYDATTDVERIRAWWCRYPKAGIGRPTGPASNCFVLDVDVQHGGDKTLARLVRRHGDLPDTPTVSTPSGGRHIYFAWPGEDIRNSAGTALGPGLDVRGRGGYVVVPPTARHDGRRYAWAVGDHTTPPAVAPEWLLHLLRKPKPEAVGPVIVPVTRASRYGQVALERAAQEVANAPAGQGNAALNGCAYSLGRLVGAGVLDRRDVEETLLAAAIARGRETESRARAIIGYGLDAGEALPRRLATFEAVNA